MAARDWQLQGWKAFSARPDSLAAPSAAFTGTILDREAFTPTPLLPLGTRSCLRWPSIGSGLVAGPGLSRRAVQ
jgi:hypothetical protein